MGSSSSLHVCLKTHIKARGTTHTEQKRVNCSNHRRAGWRRLAVAAIAAPFLLSGCGGGSNPGYNWHWSVVWGFMPLLLRGMEISLLITGLSASVGVALGIPVAAARLANWRLVRIPITAYIEVWRGTPVLIQLVWFYYALPVILGINFPAITAACTALALNMSAFSGEAFRAGIQSIPREQVESAEVLGLTSLQRLRFVVVPQAFRNVLPVLISLVIGLFKDTSLVSTLGVADLLYNGQTASTLTYRPMEILTTVAVLYFALAFPFTLIMRRVELRLRKHVRVATPIKTRTFASSLRNAMGARSGAE